MISTRKKILSIKLFADTDIGKEREINEDSVASLIINSQSSNNTIHCGILVVADGMGGHEMGEMASDLASKTFIEEVMQHVIHINKSDEKLNFSDILKKSVSAANKIVWNLSNINSKHLGTTLVGAIIFNNHVYIANVGDSRAYLVNPKKSIFQITKDHSAVQDMVDAKIITKDQARNHPRRNIITKALGLSNEVLPDIYETDFNGEILMLCSDGLYSMVDEKEIISTVNENFNSCCDKLISLANKHGGQDNISIALASC